MALTGESEGVKKDANYLSNADNTGSVEQDQQEQKKEHTLTDINMIYMGCTVQDGRGSVSCVFV